MGLQASQINKALILTVQLLEHFFAIQIGHWLLCSNYVFMWIIELLACSCSCHLFFSKFECALICHWIVMKKLCLECFLFSFFVIVAVECINSVVILLFNLTLNKWCNVWKWQFIVLLVKESLNICCLKNLEWVGKWNVPWTQHM